MINIASGRWWDEGIKLVSSCTRISEGCKNGYALAMERIAEMLTAEERKVQDVAL